LGRIDPRQEGINPGQEAGSHDVGAGPNLVVHQPFFELAQAVFGQEAAQRRRAAQLQDKMARLKVRVDHCLAEADRLQGEGEGLLRQADPEQARDGQAADPEAGKPEDPEDEGEGAGRI